MFCSLFVLIVHAYMCLDILASFGQEPRRDRLQRGLLEKELLHGEGDRTLEQAA